MKESTSNRLAFAAVVVLLAAVVAAVAGRRLYDRLEARRADLAARGWIDPETPLPDVWPYMDKRLDGIRPAYAFNEVEQDIIKEARERIPEIRMGDASIQLLDDAGEPLGAGWQVEYELYRHEFLIGYIDPAVPERDALRGELMSNLMSVHGVWTDIGSEPGEYDWRLPEQYYAREWRDAAGFTMLYHTILWNIYGKEDGEFTEYRLPRFVMEGTDREERIAMALAHVRNMAEYARGKYDIMTVWNEPVNQWANAFGLERDELLDLITQVCETYREVDPDTRIMLNLGESLFDAEIITGEALAEWIVENDAEVDVLGLQLWHNGLFPWGEQVEVAYLAQIDDGLMDYSDIGVPVIVTEFAAPAKGTPYPGWEWTEERQADFAEAVLICAAATPGCEGFTYFSTVDSFLQDSGLMKPDGQPREVFYRLRDRVDSWTTRGNSETDGEGRIDIDGFGGDYRAVARNDEGRELQYSFKIKAREQDSLSIRPAPEPTTVPEKYALLGPDVGPELILNTSLESINPDESGDHGLTGVRPDLLGVWGDLHPEVVSETESVLKAPTGFVPSGLPGGAGTFTVDLEVAGENGSIDHLQVVSGTRRFLEYDVPNGAYRLSFPVEAGDTPIVFLGWLRDETDSHVTIKAPVFIPE